MKDRYAGWLARGDGAYVVAWAVGLLGLLWVGVNGGPWLLRRPTSLAAVIDYRILSPLVAGLAAAALLTYRRGAWTSWRRDDPILWLLGYAALGAAAAVYVLPKDQPTSLYWAGAFVSALLVVALLEHSPHAADDAAVLMRMTWLAVVAVAFILLLQGFLRFGLWEDLVSGLTVRLYATYPQPFSPAFLINSNGAGRFAAVGLLVLLLHLTLPAPGWRKAAFTGAAAALLLLLAASKSRGAIAAFLGAAALGAFLRWGLGRRQAYVGGLLLLAGVVMFRDYLAGVFLRDWGQPRFWTFAGRADHWQEDLELVRASPVVGWGFFSDHILDYPHAHNAFVQSLMHAGIGGAILFVAAWVWAWKGLARAGLRDRFRALSLARRTTLMEASMILAFLTIRSLVESSGAFFGIDLLLLLPVLAVIRAASAAPRTVSRDSPTTVRAGRRLRVLVTGRPLSRPPAGSGGAAPGKPTETSVSPPQPPAPLRLMRRAGRRHDVWLLTGEERPPIPSARPGAANPPPLRVVAVGPAPAFRRLAWRARRYLPLRSLHLRRRFDVHHDLDGEAPRWATFPAGAGRPARLHGPSTRPARKPGTPTRATDRRRAAVTWTLVRRGRTFQLLVDGPVAARTRSSPDSGSLPPGLLEQVYTRIGRELRGEPNGTDDPVPTVDVLGTPIAAVRMGEAVARINRAVRQGRKSLVCVCSVNNVMTARRDPELRAAHQEAAMCLPDGWPLARAVRRSRPGLADRTRGRDLVLAVAKMAAAKGHSIFLYGAGPGVAARMASNLRRRWPQLRIAGTHSPTFGTPTSVEDRLEVRRINAARPDIVLVGLSTPKQEKWMRAHRNRLRAPVLIGLGAAFDFVAGTKRVAPDWISDRGLEWMWRFAQEPGRLWRRVVLQGPRFVGLLGWQALRDRPRGAVMVFQANATS